MDGYTVSAIYFFAFMWNLLRAHDNDGSDWLNSQPRVILGMIPAVNLMVIILDISIWIYNTVMGKK